MSDGESEPSNTTLFPHTVVVQNLMELVGFAVPSSDFSRFKNTSPAAFLIACERAHALQAMQQAMM